MLGELDDEPLRLQPVLGERGVDLADEAGADDVTGGDVHRHGREVPTGDLRARLADDPRGEVVHDRRMRHRRQEVVRHEQQVGLMLPTQQRLDATDPAGTGRDDGLVVQDELVGLERCP